MTNLDTPSESSNRKIPLRDAVAAATKLWGKPTHVTKREIRLGRRGSKVIHVQKETWYDHETGEGGGFKDLLIKAGMWVDRTPRGNGRIRGFPPSFNCRETYPYTDEAGGYLFSVCRRDVKTPPAFLQGVITAGYFKSGIKGIRRVLYHLPQLLAAPLDQWVHLVEGEKDVHAMERLGVVATTNPMGAGAWRDEYAVFLKGRKVAIHPDNDEPGETHAAKVLRSLSGIAAQAVIVRFPGVGDGGDASDWIAGGGNSDDLARLTREAGGLTTEDFYAYRPSRDYLFVPLRKLWPGKSVNAQLGKIDGMTAAAWLDANRFVTEMSWVPGAPDVIRDRLLTEGSGWIERAGVVLFNQYRPPTLCGGDPALAVAWINHAHKLFPTEADHLIKWFAHRVQRPAEKINHALVIGGSPRTGKDSLIEPLKRAVGAWNFSDVSPTHLIGDFNPWMKSTVMRINEARDLGDAPRLNRFTFYEHMKSILATPPDTQLVNEKNIKPYTILNCVGVIITTNHKTDGIYLPPDDERHFVCWTDCVLGDFAEQYWSDLWTWYHEGGFRHVAAYLRKVDLSGFNPKAPPPKTRAFWEIVSASQSPEDAEFRDALDRLGNPAVVTVTMLRAAVTSDRVLAMLNDRPRLVPKRFEDCGYLLVQNQDSKDKYWKIKGRREIVYGKQDLSYNEQCRQIEILRVG